MAQMTVKQRRPSQVPLTPLRAAAAPDGDVVHLIATTEVIPAQPSLCGSPVTGEVPRRLLTDSGCEECAGRALERGITFADDRHGAVVNLQRTRRCRRPNSA